MIIGPNKNVFITTNSSQLAVKTEKSHSNEAEKINDVFTVSDVAKKTAILTQYIQYAQSLPDIRTDKVEQAKENLKKYLREDGSIDPVVLDNIVNQLNRTLP